MLKQLFSPCRPVAGNLHRFVECAAHLASRTDAVREPRHVHFFHHLLDAAIFAADQIRFRALQYNLAASKRPGSQLFLDTDDTVFVA